MGQYGLAASSSIASDILVLLYIMHIIKLYCTTSLRRLCSLLVTSVVSPTKLCYMYTQLVDSRKCMITWVIISPCTPKVIDTDIKSG